jgi:hypothetical protein
MHKEFDLNMPKFLSMHYGNDFHEIVATIIRSFEWTLRDFFVYFTLQTPKSFFVGKIPP